METVKDWSGGAIAGGRYEVLERIGFGSMGQVYRARDHHLETEVVIKCPVPADADNMGPEFLERFDLEIRSLVHLSHPHIVRIIDVGAHEGYPYVVMQYLSGGSLKDRMGASLTSQHRPMPLPSLWDWLMDIAKALDFIHGQNYLHRDVKPDNILFDRHGNAFLSDFGIIKMLAAEGRDLQASLMTAPGYLMGTPNYVAPEIVMGVVPDARIDQYSLAMTVHEALCGSNPMQGPSPSATMVNQTKVEPPPLVDLVPGIPPRLSAAVLRGLSKKPGDRFENCVALARAILEEVPTRTSSNVVPKAGLGTVSQGELGHVECPVCRNALPLGREHAGKAVRCSRCLATLRVRFTKPNTIVLDVAGKPASSWSVMAGFDPSAKTSPPQELPAMVIDGETTRKSSGVRKWLTYGLVGIVLATCALFIRRELMNSFSDGPRHVAGRFTPRAVGDATSPGPEADATSSRPPANAPRPVEVNIAFGTEKEKWLVAAFKEFTETPQGKDVQINLIGLGSVEGAQAVLNGPNAVVDGKPIPPIHVWSPASSAYRDVFETEWEIKKGNRPIIHAENLALTPMVFVMWKHRYDEFVKKYAKVGFQTLTEAMKEPGGWGDIANKPEWGLFKFGHTDPTESNSGLQMLVLAAHEFTHKPTALKVGDVTQDSFQRWLRTFEQGVTRHGSSLTHSTGTLMKEMVLRGPSQYDCLMLYENLAIDYMKAAIERWGEEHGEIYVVYPDPNIWNEHPYYILDVPWSDDRQRKVAAEFLKFLMSEPIQRRALEHGFRPGNSSIAVSSPDSPLVVNRKFGLKIELPVMCEPPNAEVVKNLLGSFQRIER